MGIKNNFGAAKLNLKFIEEYLKDAKQGGYADIKNAPELHLAHIKSLKVMKELEEFEEMLIELDNLGELE